MVLRSLPGTQVVVYRYDLTFSTHERHVQGLLHPEHVHCLAVLQQEPFASLQRGSSEQALEPRPESARNGNPASEIDAVTGEVSHGHLPH
jgi:hypothetical protein